MGAVVHEQWCLRRSGMFLRNHPQHFAATPAFKGHKP